MASRQRPSILGISIAVFVSACGGSGGESPTTPTTTSGGSAVSSVQATSTAENVGTLTLTAIQNGAAQVGVRSAPTPSRRGNGPLAASGSIFGTATCPGGGRLDLTHIRDYTPSGGDIDLSALKAVYTACLFTSSGASFQIAGELALSGRYYGASRTPEINVSGSLTTSNGTCAISGGVNATGGFSGTACGTSATTNPPAPPPPAPTFNGTYTGRSDSGDDPGDNPLSFVVTGGVAIFTSGGEVLPGTVSGSGQLAARGGSCDGTLTGQITLTSSGGATAEGTWSHPTSSHCGNANSGLWTATRQP